MQPQYSALLLLCSHIRCVTRASRRVASRRVASNERCATDSTSPADFHRTALCDAASVGCLWRGGSCLFLCGALPLIKQAFDLHFKPDLSQENIKCRIREPVVESAAAKP